MQKKKAKDYRTTDREAQRKELTELRRELFNLRMQKATGQLSNSVNLKRVRRNIARLLTVINEQRGKV